MKMETLMKQTNNELRDIAWAEGVPYSKLNKADLVARILDYRATCKGKRVFDKNFIPDCFKTQDMCDKAVDEFPWCFRSVPDKFKTQKMCEKAFDEYPELDVRESLDFIPDKFKTQEICAKAVDKYPQNFKYVPYHHISPEMCDKAVDKNPQILGYVPDCFITQEMIENGGRSCCKSCNYEFHDWFNGYKHRKAQKAQIKDELTPIAWHPDRVIDWCFDEEEKKDLKRLWGSVEL